MSLLALPFQVLFGYISSVWQAYNRAYKAHYARYLKKKMTTAEFERWSRYTVRLREQAEAGTLALAEYEATLKI